MLPSLLVGLPINPPRTFEITSGQAICHQTWPWIANVVIVTRFVTALQIFAIPEALRKEYPPTATYVSTQKVPTPGPIAPS